MLFCPAERDEKRGGRAGPLWCVLRLGVYSMPACIYLGKELHVGGSLSLSLGILE